MAEQDPHLAFNYHVTISGGADVQGGFSEVSGLGGEVEYADYREGTDERNAVRKIAGLLKVGEVTLSRGIITGKGLGAWFEKAQRGDPTAKATVVIRLKSEDQSRDISTWTLKDSRPSKWEGPTFAATSSEVAMEKLTLVSEHIEFNG